MTRCSREQPSLARPTRRDISRTSRRPGATSSSHSTRSVHARVAVRGLARTIEALRAGADVIYQGALFDGTFGGLADFLIRGENGLYEVWDTKLTRHAKVEALLQVAAYADLLEGAGIHRSQRGFLRLGDNPEFSQDLDEIIHVYRQRRATLEKVLTSTSRRWRGDCVERSPLRHLRVVRALPGRDRGQR